MPGSSEPEGLQRILGGEQMKTRWEVGITPPPKEGVTRKAGKGGVVPPGVAMKA